MLRTWQVASWPCAAVLPSVFQGGHNLTSLAIQISEPARTMHNGPVFRLLLALLFAAASAADALITLKLLGRPGKREANPLLRRLFQRFGAGPSLLITKGIIVAAVTLVLALDLPGASTVTILLILATGGAAIFNLLQLRPKRSAVL